MKTLKIKETGVDVTAILVNASGLVCLVLAYIAHSIYKVLYII